MKRAGIVLTGLLLAVVFGCARPESPEPPLAVGEGFVQCAVCKGVGSIDRPCDYCGGRGKNKGSKGDWYICRVCDGKGHRVAHCEACGGNGKVIQSAAP